MGKSTIIDLFDDPKPYSDDDLTPKEVIMERMALFFAFMVTYGFFFKIVFF